MVKQSQTQAVLWPRSKHCSGLSRGWIVPTIARTDCAHMWTHLTTPARRWWSADRSMVTSPGGPTSVSEPGVTPLLPAAVSGAGGSRDDPCPQQRPAAAGSGFAQVAPLFRPLSPRRVIAIPHERSRESRVTALDNGSRPGRPAAMDRTASRHRMAVIRMAIQ